jgi:predicted component of type VI protein secretion system
MPFIAPELILEELPPDVEIVAPAGLAVGGAILAPPAVQGRWITIGAGPDQDIVVRDQPPGISRSHCRMILRGGAFLIQGRLHPDGYAINGERFHDCTPRPLRDGDRVTVGKYVTLRFCQTGQGSSRGEGKAGSAAALPEGDDQFLS